MKEYKIRPGKKEDINSILDLIKELAIYEKAENEVSNTSEQMLIDGFGDKPIFKFFVAENNNRIIGTAIYFYSYSTWKGKCIYLEDLIVTESHRGNGIGKLFFEVLIKEAQIQKAKRLVWQVLDWNEPAINFYKKYDAVLDGEWINCKLTEKQINNYNIDK